MAPSRAMQQLKAAYPFLKLPIIVSAPMRVFAGPDLAVATSRAGGLGFIGPGVNPTDLEPKLENARRLLEQNPVSYNSRQTTSEQNSSLPIGVGFQLFDGDLDVALAAVRKYRPVAAWLFVPKTGQSELDHWSSMLRQESRDIQIWIQVGSVAEARAAAESKHAPDVLVLQGIDAGGHGLKKGAGVMSLLPEVSDALREAGIEIPLFGAGGIADGRGVAAILATGVAAGAVMGTRFLASREAEIKKGYQDDVVRVSDGGQSTVRTTLFDRLQSRDDWPERYDGRAIINSSVLDDQTGMNIAVNKELFLKKTSGWGVDGRLTAYVGSAVGLVRKVESAEEIINSAREDARTALKQAVENVDS